jgi:hypothetical protein
MKLHEIVDPTRGDDDVPVMRRRRGETPGIFIGSGATPVKDNRCCQGSGIVKRLIRRLPNTFRPIRRSLSGMNRERTGMPVRLQGTCPRNNAVKGRIQDRELRDHKVAQKECRVPKLAILRVLALPATPDTKFFLLAN